MTSEMAGGPPAAPSIEWKVDGNPRLERSFRAFAVLSMTKRANNLVAFAPALQGFHALIGIVKAVTNWFQFLPV